MKTYRFLSLLGVSLACTTGLLSGFEGHGFNDCTGVYQWDNGTLSSVASTSTDNADAITSDKLRGNHAPSIANGFDTRHRGLEEDTIEAVQFAIVDTAAFFRSLKALLRDPLGTSVIPPAGQTITVAIWPGCIPCDQLTRDNASFTQDYVIQQEDVGITSNFASNCPEYVGIALNDIPPFTINPCSCAGEPCTVCGKNCFIFEGNGSNILPTVTDKPGFANHTRRICENVNQGTGQQRKNPFSEYPANFLTIGLDHPVKVEKEFWVGFLFDFPVDPTPFQDTRDDDLLGISVGVSVINLDKEPRPCGQNAAVHSQCTGLPLENNAENIATPACPCGDVPETGGFTGIPITFLPGGTVAARQDEVQCIRAVPISHRSLVSATSCSTSESSSSSSSSSSSRSRSRTHCSESSSSSSSSSSSDDVHLVRKDNN